MTVIRKIVIKSALRKLGKAPLSEKSLRFVLYWDGSGFRKAWEQSDFAR
jgi:hypothetical protein